MHVWNEFVHEKGADFLSQQQFQVAQCQQSVFSKVLKSPHLESKQIPSLAQKGKKNKYYSTTVLTAHGKTG